MHIVVTSRSRALERQESCTEKLLKEGKAEIKCKFRNGGSRRNDVKLLASLTSEEQINWVERLIGYRKNKGNDTSDLERYKQTFQSLQKNEDITGLLGIPILLRMVVQNCFEPTSDNRVSLYRDLFDKTLIRQGLEQKRDLLHSIYQEIAFSIFVYDDDCAIVDKAEFKEITDSEACLYQYYLHTPEKEVSQAKEDKYSISFLHRSFYQYFLSEFFYGKLESIKDEKSGEDFLKYLWARRIDYYV